MSLTLLSGRAAKTGAAGLGRPVLALSATAVPVALTAGDPDPAPITVTYRNAGTGALSGPVVTGARYTGGSTGWTALGALDPVTRSVTATLTTGTLGVGAHTTAFDVTDARGGTVTVTITVTVSAAVTPTILLETTSRSFNATEGGSDPGAQTVAITNGGGGTLAPCVPTVTDGSGGAATWLSATVTPGTASNSQLLTLQPTTGALTAQTLPYDVSLASTGASNTPQSVSGTFTIAAAGGSAVSVASAVQRFDGGSGSVLVCCGFPLRPGDLTQTQHDAQQVRVLVGGVEQAIATTALYSRHPDGSLAAIGVQFHYPIPNATAITAEVRIGETRTTTDISYTPVVEDMVYNTVDDGPVATIRPTDLDYLCATHLTLEPLAPASTESPAVSGMMQTRMNAVFNVSAGGSTAALKNTNVGVGESMGAPTTYDCPISLIAAWMRTGDVAYYTYAYRRGRWQQNPRIPAPGTAGAAVANPEGLTGASDPRKQEVHNIQFFGMIAQHRLTAWAQPLRTLAYYLNGTTMLLTTQAQMENSNNGAVDDIYGGRFNLGQRWGALVPGYISGVRMAVPTLGGGAGRLNNYVNELPWALGAIDLRKFTTGDFRDGITGIAPTSSDGGAFSVGQFSNFQQAWIAQYYLRYWQYIDRDSRLPTWITTIGDFLIAQFRLADARETVDIAAYAGIYVETYGCVADPNAVGGVRQGIPPKGPMAPYEMPMYAGLWAWLYAFYNDASRPATYDATRAATYKTWAERALNPAQSTPGTILTWNWKTWAEFYATSQNAGYYLNGGAPDGGLPVPGAIANPTAQTSLV